MLKTDDLVSLLQLLDEGKAVVEELDAGGLDREAARVRLAGLLTDAIRIFDVGREGNGHPAPTLVDSARTSSGPRVQVH